MTSGIITSVFRLKYEYEISLNESNVAYDGPSLTERFSKIQLNLSSMKLEEFFLGKILQSNYFDDEPSTTVCRLDMNDSWEYIAS